jgi:hypothetical protein
MFPYKSFFERHAWIGYLLLIISVIGFFFIPWFNRWLNNKEQEYNRQLQRSYKLLIINKLLLKSYPHTFINFRLQSLSEMQITLAFRNAGFAKSFANLIGAPYKLDKYESLFDRENDFSHDDELFPYKIVVSHNKLNRLLKQFFAMTPEQTNLMWHGLHDINRDLQNSNKYDIIDTFAQILAQTTSYTVRSSGIVTYSSQYSFRFVKQQRCSYSSIPKYDVGFKFTFLKPDIDSDIPRRFRSLIPADEGVHYEEERGKKLKDKLRVVFLTKNYGLINMLLRFGIPEEQARSVTEEIFETVPKIRRTTRVLAQAYRTQNEFFGKLLPELNIKIAAFTAPNGTNSETAEQIAASHFGPVI